MWQLDGCGEMLHFILKNAEAGESRSFSAARVQGLKTKANAEKRSAAEQCNAKGCAKAVRVERGQKSGRMADAGKNDTGGTFYLRRIGREANLSSESAEGASHGGDVTGAIVKKGNDQRSSLVLGST